MTAGLPSALAAMAAKAATGPLVPLADALLRASLAGALFIGAVWLLCRLAPRLPASVRTTLWWLACLKLLVGCVWLSPVELPLLPAPELAPASSRPALVAAAPAPRAPRAGAPSPAATEPAAGEADLPALAPERSGPPWLPLAVPLLGLALMLALVLAWLAGVAAGGTLTAVHAVRLARTVRSAHGITDGPTADLFEALRRRLGLSRRPALKTTPRVASPQAVGLVRPTILLPPSALAASRDELTMMLCHELVHLRRRDPWLAWVPLLARRLFFFHPLAALAQREFVLAREAACDAEVLRLLGTAPRAYGRLLLRWGVAPRETGLAAAGASSSVQDLKRRLQMLDSTDSTRRSSPWWWLAAATLVLGLVPVTIVAQAPPAPPAERPTAPPPEAAPAKPPDAPPEARTPAPTEPADAPSAVETPPAGVPAPAPAAIADLGPVGAAPAAPEVPGVAAVPATPGVAAPAAPPAPPAPPTAPSSGTTWTWSNDGDDYALLLENSHMILHGDSDDADHVRSLRTGDEPLLWFRHDGTEYVVHDAKTIERARRIVSPQMELARQQGELGGRQGELGGRQGELGADQGRLGAQQAELAARQAALATTAVGGDEDARSRQGADQRELAARMRELAERQRELGQRQRELGERQRALGDQQKELGKQQRAAAERAQKEMAELIDRALSEGLAERVH